MDSESIICMCCRDPTGVLLHARAGTTAAPASVCGLDTTIRIRKCFANFDPWPEGICHRTGKLLAPKPTSP